MNGSWTFDGKPRHYLNYVSIIPKYTDSGTMEHGHWWQTWDSSTMEHGHWLQTWDSGTMEHG